MILKGKQHLPWDLRGIHAEYNRGDSWPRQRSVRNQRGERNRSWFATGFDIDN